MITTINIANNVGAVRELLIEPWAEEFLLDEDSGIVLKISTDTEVEIGVEIQGSYLIFTAPPHSTCRLEKNGIDISKGLMLNPAP